MMSNSYRILLINSAKPRLFAYFEIEVPIVKLTDLNIIIEISYRIEKST